MDVIEGKRFDEERALYGSRQLQVTGCSFDGPADGESALKESSEIVVDNCEFKLRYPFWHDHVLKITNCRMFETCRAPLWYSDNIEIKDTKMHGVKALRECKDVKIDSCGIISPEFGWSVSNIEMKNTSVESEYFMMRSDNLTFENLNFNFKYSFQYIKDGVFTNCVFDTKDAFWHAKNVTVKNCTVKGEYLAWYCENVTFENCTITGTQPFCYCEGLKLINCTMVGCDLAFEKSEAEAEVLSSMVSIQNPKSGTITVQSVGEIIRDDPESKAEIKITGQS